jgi:hypothetical protein
MNEVWPPILNPRRDWPPQALMLDLPSALPRHRRDDAPALEI